MDGTSTLVTCTVPANTDTLNFTYPDYPAVPVSGFYPVTYTAAASRNFRIRVTRVSSAGEVIAYYGKIAAYALGSTDGNFYLASSTSGAASFTTAATLNVTSATASDYLIMVSANVTSSNSVGAQLRVRVNGNTAYVVNGIYTSTTRSVSHFFKATGINGTQAINLDVANTDASATSVSIQNISIVAIRLADLDSSYYVENLTRVQYANNGVESNQSSLTFTPTAGNFFSIACAELDGSGAASQTNLQYYTKLNTTNTKIKSRVDTFSSNSKALITSVGLDLLTASSNTYTNSFLAGNATFGTSFIANSRIAAVSAVPVVVTPVMVTATLAAGEVGVPYQQTIITTGTTPTSFALTSGSLPGGITLNTTTGALSGIPTTPTASTSITITATNSAGSVSLTTNISVINNSGGSSQINFAGDVDLRPKSVHTRVGQQTTTRVISRQS